MLSASAAPRWKMQISTLPRALPYVAAPFMRSAAYTLRFRKLGARPSVTKESAPDLTNARLFILYHPERSEGPASVVILSEAKDLLPSWCHPDRSEGTASPSLKFR